MECLGKVKNGVVVLDGDVTLIEGKTVRVIVQEEDSQQIPTLYELFKDVIGTATGLPADLSENHDHYIHGTPKKARK